LTHRFRINFQQTSAECWVVVPTSFRGVFVKAKAQLGANDIKRLLSQQKLSEIFWTSFTFEIAKHLRKFTEQSPLERLLEEGNWKM